MRLIAPSLAIIVAGGAGACVNARDSYDDFPGRLIDADTREIDGPIVTSLPDIGGDDWYMVAAVQLGAEEKLVHFRCTFAFRPLTENTAEIDWTAQGLDYETLEPVGEPFSATDVVIGTDASGDIPMVGELAARVNSISGSDAAVDAVIHIQLRSDQFVCGELTGQAGALSLDGINTFGGIRVGDVLPAPATSCDDEPTS